MTNDERDKMISETHADIKVLLGSVGRHEKTLYGNGRPGLCTRVQIMETTGKLFVSLCAAAAAIAGSSITVVIQRYITSQ